MGARSLPLSENYDMRRAFTSVLETRLERILAMLAAHDINTMHEAGRRSQDLKGILSTSDHTLVILMLQELGFLSSMAA